MQQSMILCGLFVRRTVFIMLLIMVYAACLPSPEAIPISPTIESNTTDAPPDCPILPSSDGDVIPSTNALDIGSTNTLAFVTPSSDGDIMLARLDGTEPINLTNHPSRDSLPVWSPDGTRIAFTSDRDGAFNIYLMNKDGSEVTPIWHGKKRGSWSPDGTRIVFAYNAGGIGHLRQWSTTDITTLLQLDHTIASPQWSPNGSQILFTTYEENVWLWVVDADGRNASRLINGQRLERPVWSPDGSYIAFVAFRANSAAIELELIKSDGSCHTVLTSDLFSSTEPAWSPDGRQIAFVAKKKLEVANHLFVMNVDGSQRRQITTEEARYSAPTWSPDGHYLAYVQKHIVQNKWTVYVLDMRDPDAQPQKIGLGSHPAWQPQP